jgi:NAD(P)-dependent dehydrogenase (short-subunit alcohol dehydrogenase family)
MADAKRVLITAGAAGIGLAMARAFVAAGARVHVCDIDANALNAIGKELPAVSVSACDVSDRAAVQVMVGEAVDALGGLDTLVNNAGISGPTATVEDFDAEAWEAVMRVNLNGTFYVTQAAIPHLRAAGGGSVIVMSSLAGRAGYPQRSAYATSKWGLVGFTKTLSRELGPDGIRVNAILPGAVEGQRIQSVLQGRAKASGRGMKEEIAGALANQSVKRFVDPVDIAALAVFLASDHGKSISGQAIPIDGDSQSAS